MILSLLDDLNSQQHIDTLRNYIREVRPRQAVDPQIAEFRQAENLRFRLRNNLAEHTGLGGTRCCSHDYGVFCSGFP